MTNLAPVVGSALLIFAGILIYAASPPPEVAPPPLPKITTESISLPYGNVAALQKLGLLPRYRSTGTTVAPDTNIDWRGTTGERGEIGLLPEQHAAFIAGQANLLDSILETAKTPPPAHISHSHKPNLYWLPYLMTGDTQYVRNMEATYKQHRDWHQSAYDSGFDHKCRSRELAWSLRDLAQLTYLQKLGLTQKTYYIPAFNKTRARYLQTTKTTDVKYQTWNVLEFDRISGWKRYGWSGWMESMVGQVLNQIVAMGFTDWLPIAEWHFLHLLKRSGDKWPFKAVDNDHVKFVRYPVCERAKDWSSILACTEKSDWVNVTAYPPSLQEKSEYQALPNDKLISLSKVGGVTYTYWVRAQYAYGWAALACDNGIPRACIKRDQLHAAIKLRGDRWDHKNSFIGRK
jgi:hypothetical protein